MQQNIYNSSVIHYKHMESLPKIYQFEAVVSKQKHSIVKIYDSHQKYLKKLKVISITNCQRVYIRSLCKVVEEISKVYQKRSQQFQQIKQLIYTKENKEYLIIESKYFNGDSLARTLQKQKSLDRPKNLQSTILQQTFQLLDCFLQIVELNTFIPTANNIYVECDRFKFNLSSLVGFDLIFFEMPIKKNQFKQIYSCLDSAIFKRNRQNRLNHKFKMHCFASLLLVLIFQRPIRLLNDTQLEQVITLQRAKQLMMDLPNRYKKFLNIKEIRQTLAKYSQYYNVNLQDFLKIALVQEHIDRQQDNQNGEIKETITWCHLFQKLKRVRSEQDNKDIKQLIDQFADKIWRNSDPNYKQKLEKLRIVQTYFNNDQKADLIKDNNKQLLLLYQMGLKFTDIDQYSLEQELKKKNQRYDKNSEKLVFQLLKIWNNIIQRNNTQSIFQPTYANVLEQNQFLQSVIREIEMSPNLVEQSQISTNDSFRYDQNSNQGQNLTQNHTQCYEYSSAQQQSTRRKIKRKNDEIIDDIKELMKNKLMTPIQIQGKIVIIQHQRWKSLSTFQRSMR